MEHQFKVKKSERGKRIDTFLYDKMGNWSHKRIKLAIDHKTVFVNGKNIFISSWNLKPGDRVVFKAQREDAPQEKEPTRYHFVTVLYEDDALLVVNKPAFIDYDSFVTNVNSYLKRQHKDRKFYPYLGQMHRLDKETSGVLIFTKKKSANVLADQFRDHRIRKIYYALVKGNVPNEHGTITDPIEKGKFEGGKKARIAEDGKESHTEYWVEERYPAATYLKIQLKTGRTHQIRIHFSNKGFPLLGDKLYAEEQAQKKAAAPKPKKEGSGLLAEAKSKPLPKSKRHMLHAFSTEFYHPLTKKKMKVTAPLPDDFLKVRDQLRDV